MNKVFLTYLSRLLAAFAFAWLLFFVAGCKKAEESNPLLACRPSSGGGGVGTLHVRPVMFWINQDFGCGPLNLISMRNTETNNTYYSSYPNASVISKYSPVQPACGTAGTITIEVSQGYEYEYTIACSSRQWKGKVTVDCSSTDCIPIQLK